MEFLPGLETSVDVVCENGTVLSHACRTKVKETRIISTGGEAFEIAEAVAKLMNLDGLVNVQLKKDLDGKHKVLEVNTRPAGGFVMSNLCGINLALDCVKMMHGEKVISKLLDGPVQVKSVDAYTRLSQ